MKMVIYFLFSFISILSIGCLRCPTEISFDQIFNGRVGTFVLFDYNNKTFIKHNPERSKERFKPCSTFKIPNSLIGLESGVIEDENFVIKWDGKPKFVKAWERDHSLKTAIEHSVVPYYMELARRVGREEMQHFLDKLNYGNKTIGQEDYFWLDGSLQISAEEQIVFLVNFYENKLPFSQRNIDIVKDIIIREKNSSYIWRSKTGMGRINDEKVIGWYVGYVEVKDNVYFFAMNIEAETYNDVAPLREKITKEIFKYLQII